MMTLHEAAQALGVVATTPGQFGSVGTDSRKITAGQLFVALRGERFDGHEFVAQAAAEGAAAALVDAQWVGAQGGPSPLPLLVVADTRLALGRLAAHWRARFAIPVIGVTGSNGKTTVKEMCTAVMRAQARRDGYGAQAVLATAGNLNNDIGLPLTLLELRSSHRAAIVEMGMNRPGEIAYLAGLARPTVAVVTNAQRAHLQGMGTVIGIAREKGAIYEALEPDGVAVINADDTQAGYWRKLNASRRVLTFALKPEADVSGLCTLRGLGSHVDMTTPAGRIAVDLQVPGEHNARNATGAAAACLAAGASPAAIAEGLAAYTGTRGRLQRRAGPNGAVVLDDSYNANPDSLRAGIDVLAATPGQKILVLGDMGEIGWTSAQVHDEIGGYAKSKGVDALFALGEMSAVAASNFGDGGRHFASVEALVAALTRKLDGDTVVLVKGSRFMRMERVADALAAVHNGAPSTETK